jgi:hypothetical protein
MTGKVRRRGGHIDRDIEATVDNPANLPLTEAELEALGICTWTGELRELCIDTGTCNCGTSRDMIAQANTEANEDLTVIREARES